MRQANYEKAELEFISRGFREGFPIGYEGPTNVKLTARNLPLKCGSLQDIWDKVMKEVSLKRFTGPFVEVPFDSYIQSPIGLVPKHQVQSSNDGAHDNEDKETQLQDEGDRLNQTRLIFIYQTQS